jgi:RNA polymerase sigma factor (sigma-70 family)
VEHLDDVREPRALPGWLVTVARNEALRVIKLRGRVLPFEPERSVLDVAVGDHADDGLIRQEEHAALLAALDELPDKRRELLRLLLADPPVSYREISARLGIPVGYIGPTRARALAQLRETASLRAYRQEGEPVSGGGRHVAMG